MLDRRLMLQASFAALLLPSMARAQRAGELYGMIEIGSRGVKVGTYRFTNELLADDSQTTSGRERLAPQREGKSYTVNTGVRNGTPQGIVDTTKAVEAALEDLKGRRVAPVNIIIVASSGVDNIKSSGAFEELKRQVRAATGFDLRSVTVDEESRLSFDWVVLGARRSQVLLVDVGSGNTKGGYYERLGEPQQRFRSFSMPYGTTSLEKKIKGLWPDEPVITHAAQAFRDDPELLPSLRRQVSTAPGLASKPRVYLAGGIVWATATLTRPVVSVSGAPWVRLAPSNFAQLRAQIQTNKPYAVSIPPGTPAETRAKIEKTVTSIQETFSPDQLAAGVSILEGMSKELAFEARAAMFFASFATDAWSSEFLFEKFGGSTS